MTKFYSFVAVCFISLLMLLGINVQTASAGVNAGTIAIGGLAESGKKANWCCSMFADLCVPCDNASNLHAYKSPNPCSNTVTYQELVVRCMDPTCNNLSKGDYSFMICTQTSIGFSTGKSCAGSCAIGFPGGPGYCRENSSVSVPASHPVWLEIRPSSAPDTSPNAPFNGLWSALAANCND